MVPGQVTGRWRSPLAGSCVTSGGAPGAARAIVVYAPDEVRHLTDTLGPVPSLALIRAIEDEFDPQHRMASGRLAHTA